MLARLDNRLLLAMRTRGHTPAIEEAARLLAFVGEYGAIWFALGILFGVLDSGHREEWIFAGALGPFAIGINYAVKVLVGRRRPVLEGLPPLGRAPSSLSFPSAHTTASFAAATAMTRVDPTAALLFVLAIAIALGRPYLGMHYPSDVLGGAVLGVALGLIWPLALVS